MQRQIYADILNIEQSAKNTEFHKRYRNFSLQEIKHLARIQIEFAKSETCKTINLHYRKLERIIKKTKNIVMYIDASQIRKKIAEIETETETTVIFTHEFVRYSKATSIYDKIITTKAKLQAISDAIATCSEKALKNSEI